MPWPSPIKRFEKKYIISETGCWEWQGCKDVDGYGRFMLEGYQIRAHRFSYLHFHGESPEGMSVCHSCDNPSCVNPKHLWLGTNADNNKDRLLKGRYKSQEKRK